ncbi:MAG TPA: GNAT family protein [Xanthomonadaceae bacterium]|nr:GNAT family protein [Xanthomonadaceae bacterium]
MTPPDIEGGDLRLRPMEHSDIEAWYGYLCLPHVLEHTSWNLASAGELRLLVDEYSSSAPSKLCFAIESVTESRLVGAIGFHTISPVHRSAEIAFNLNPEYWGRGIATRCCNAVADWGFSDQGYVRIQAVALDTNLASMSVIEKCGFVREGKLRSFRLVRGQPRDFWVYSRVANEPG